MPVAERTSACCELRAGLVLGVSSAELARRTFVARCRQYRACADWYATWCKGCKRMLPELSKLAGTYGDRVKFVKVRMTRQTCKHTPCACACRRQCRSTLLILP